ncbi:uncharacterized protein RNJ42_02866 [Nakaseomyces bracarensis]|uniref:uncharacterized protein n=1 Tax=Nakaseomyces bracarensis TaxID=273131 RepID=UPI0038719004
MFSESRDGESMEEVKEELNRYILDFFQKSSFSKTASTFSKECSRKRKLEDENETNNNIKDKNNESDKNNDTDKELNGSDKKKNKNEDKEVVDTPQGFLYEWWQVFWDIFNSTTNRGGSEVAQSYFKMVVQEQRQEHIYRSLAIHAARLQHIAEQRGEYEHEDADPMMFAMMLSRLTPNMNLNVDGDSSFPVGGNNIFHTGYGIPNNNNNINHMNTIPTSTPAPAAQPGKKDGTEISNKPSKLPQQKKARKSTEVETTVSTSLGNSRNIDDNSQSTNAPSPTHQTNPAIPGTFMFSPQQMNDYIGKQMNDGGKASDPTNTYFSQAPFSGRPTPVPTTSSEVQNFNMMAGFPMPMMGGMSPNLMQQNPTALPNWYMYGMPNNQMQMDQMMNMFNQNKKYTTENNHSSNLSSNDNEYGNNQSDAYNSNGQIEKPGTKSRKDNSNNEPKSSKKRSPSLQEIKESKSIYSNGSPENNFVLNEKQGRETDHSNNNDSPNSVKQAGLYSPSLGNINESYSNPGSARSPASTGGETPSSSKNMRTSKLTKNKVKTPGVQSTSRKKRVASTQTVTTPKTMIITPVLTSSVNQNATPSSIGHFEGDSRNDDFEGPVINSGGNSKKSTISPHDYPSIGSTHDVGSGGSATTPIDAFPVTQRVKKTTKSFSNGISPKNASSPTLKSTSGTSSPKRASISKKNIRRKSTPVLHEQPNSDPASLRKSTPGNLAAPQDEGSNATTPNIIFNNMSMVNFTNKPALSSPLSTVPESYFENENGETKKTPSSFIKASRNDKYKEQSTRSNNNTPISSNNFNDHIDSSEPNTGSHGNTINSINSTQSNDSHHSQPTNINENLSENKSSKSTVKSTPTHHNVVDAIGTETDSKLNFESGLTNAITEETDQRNDGNDIYNFYGGEKHNDDLLFFDSMFDDAMLPNDSAAHGNDNKISEKLDINEVTVNNDSSTEPNILLESNDHDFFMD